MAMLVLVLVVCGTLAWSRRENGGTSVVSPELFAPAMRSEAAAMIRPIEASQEHNTHPTTEPVGGWKAELAALESLAQKDPDTALKRVSQMQEPHERKSAAIRVCRVVGNADPEKAARAAWDFNLGRFATELDESRTLEHLARLWADAEPGRALDWVAALPVDDESRRDYLVKGIVSSIAQKDPPLAARIVAETSSLDNPVPVDAAMEVLRTWSARDYEAAMRWLANLSSPLARERGIDQLADSQEPGP